MLNLETALERVTLSNYVAQYLERHGLQMRGNRFRAVWRGGTGNNCEVCKSKNGHEYVKDHVNNEVFGIWTWLTKIEGLTKKQAANKVLTDAGMSDAPRHTQKPESSTEILKRKFRLEHPNADPCFFASWLELRLEGWYPIGSSFALSAAFCEVGKVKNLPILTTLARAIGNTDKRVARLALEALANWIAFGIAEVT